MVRKFHESQHGQQLEFWGSGRPMRQQLYVGDMAKLIPVLLEKHLANDPIIVSPNENLTIEEMIKICLKISSKDVQYRFNGEYEGQHRKDGSNKKLLDLIGQFEFTPFEEGLRETYEWYKSTS